MNKEYLRELYLAQIERYEVRANKSFERKEYYLNGVEYYKNEIEYYLNRVEHYKNEIEKLKD